MRVPLTFALFGLAGQLVGASTTADSSCGTCAGGYICSAGTCVLDTSRLTANPLPIITSKDPGGPIKTTGMSAPTDTVSMGETTTTTTTMSATTGAVTPAESTPTGNASAAESSSSPSMTPLVSSTGSVASSSSAGAAASTTKSGVASSASLEWDSLVAWGLAWVIGLPLVA